MSAIKDLIGVFCKLTELHNFSPLSAEDFRQAKFNQKSCLQKMWTFLYELLMIKNYPNFPVKKQSPSSFFNNFQ